jgi:hypothetical protein
VSYSWATMRRFQVFSPNMQIPCIFWMTFEKIIKIYLNFTLSVPFLLVCLIDFMYCLLSILLYKCYCHASLYHRCHWRYSSLKFDTEPVCVVLIQTQKHWLYWLLSTEIYCNFKSIPQKHTRSSFLYKSSLIEYKAFFCNYLKLIKGPWMFLL